MFQMFEPTVLAENAVTLPWPVASGIGLALTGAIGVLWRRCVVLEDRSRTDNREVLPVMRDAVKAVEELADQVERMADTLNVTSRSA